MAAVDPTVEYCAKLRAYLDKEVQALQVLGYTRESLALKQELQELDETHFETTWKHNDALENLLIKWIIAPSQPNYSP